MSERQKTQQKARFIDEAWCRALRRAAEPITRKELATRVGFSVAKLQEYLAGHRKPSMDDLVRLADALNYPKLRLLTMAGYLEGIANLLSYMDQLEDQAERMEYAAKRMPGEPLYGAARIANSALSEADFEVGIRPVWLGTGARRRHYSDRVVLRSLNGAAVSLLDRQRVEAALHDELAWFGAGFVEGWAPGQREFVINVPRFVAARKGSGAPMAGVPRSIAVIGGHWAGSADVASFLGHAFDYDYSHVGLVASRAFSRLTHRWGDADQERDRLEVVRTYVEGSDLGRTRVWAADVGDSEAAAKVIAASRSARTPLVIHLRPTDDLLDWTAHTRSERRHTTATPAEEMRRLRAVRQRVDTTLGGIAHRTLVLPAPLPSSVRAGGSDGDRSSDGFFDMWAGLAEASVGAMHQLFPLAFARDEALTRLKAVK
ncbi:helix-turn-helix transcriptional regulator [Streptomyces sp. NBC_00536]|uniref:helix-turn-helix transcriptional regulator n=1 Tax=Streptomyces sp. NBC_00536 TaxID=2975769 RepID=UPI002E81369A|nr:helix-turn-helix transcriptional regulator [Streptomyces sp. NBC_00536]WUC78869.1 helix-turn-helix transcriptional regulator [Streptomyces sp. NBC_00536]